VTSLTLNICAKNGFKGSLGIDFIIECSVSKATFRDFSGDPKLLLRSLSATDLPIQQHRGWYNSGIGSNEAGELRD